MSARYVGAGSVWSVERGRAGRDRGWGLVGGVAHALRSVPRVALLSVVVALAWAVPAAASDVYVTNVDSGNVSQYNVGLGGLLAPKSPATVLAGVFPQGVVVSPDGTSVYVAGGPPSGNGTVSQYTVGAGGALTPKSPAPVGAGVGAFEVAVSPDGNSLYVTNSNGRTVSQYDVGAGGVLAPKSPPRAQTGQTPGGVAVSPDGHNVYVANTGAGTVSQYSVGVGGKLSLKKAGPVGAGTGPFEVAVSRDSHSVYVTNLDSNNISQYNVGTGGALTPKTPPTVTTANQPVGIAVSPDGHSVYVTNNTLALPSGRVSQYNVGTGGALTPKTPPRVASAALPSEVVVSPDGHDVYAVTGARSSGNGTVSQYTVGAGGTLTPKNPATVGAGANPFGIAVRPTLGTPQPPPAPTIEDVIASVQALGLPGGIKNALLAKLTGAQRDLAANNRGGACGKLGAFINQVQAHSAKKIPAGDAQALTDQATAVSRSLGCGG
jgi:DNA-binding beta-propeller fold protein YncE